MDSLDQIELAPRDGEIVILQDRVSGAWEVGRWATESNSWMQLNEKPIRLFPTHWVPASGDAAGSNNKQAFSFVIESSIPESSPLNPRRYFTLAIAAVVIFTSGYAASFVGKLGVEWKFSRLDGIFDVGLVSQAVDAGISQADISGRNSMSPTTVTVDRDFAHSLQLQRSSAAFDNEQKKGPGEDAKIFHERLGGTKASEPKLAIERKDHTTTGTDVNDLSRVGELHSASRAVQELSVLPASTGPFPGTKNPHSSSMEAPTFHHQAVASASPQVLAIGPSQTPVLPGRSRRVDAISSTDEARLLARAQFLIEQSDIAGARLLLEYGMEKGSAEAIFMLAETYENRVHLSRGGNHDADKAVKLYELAATAGFAKARERLEIIKGASH